MNVSNGSDEASDVASAYHCMETMDHALESGRATQNANTNKGQQVHPPGNPYSEFLVYFVLCTGPPGRRLPPPAGPWFICVCEHEHVHVDGNENNGEAGNAKGLIWYNHKYQNEAEAHSTQQVVAVQTRPHIYFLIITKNKSKLD